MVTRIFTGSLAQRLCIGRCIQDIICNLKRQPQRSAKRADGGAIVRIRPCTSSTGQACSLDQCACFLGMNRLQPGQINPFAFSLQIPYLSIDHALHTATMGHGRHCFASMLRIVRMQN